MINEEIVHVNGQPQKLVVFLHGYIDSAPALDRRLQPLLDHLPDSAVHIPQAPEICEILDNKRQWYSMHRFDPDDARKFVPTMEECAEIYNRMGLGLAEAFSYLNPYLQERLDDYGFICLRFFSGSHGCNLCFPDAGRKNRRLHKFQRNYHAAFLFAQTCPNGSGYFADSWQ